jgi:predicted nucleic acid-binding protein
MHRFYVDTCIWIDFLEDRTGYQGEPLGEYAFHLFTIIRQRGILAWSDILRRELYEHYPKETIDQFVRLFDSCKVDVSATEEELRSACTISLKRKLPAGDVLHALLARNHGFTLVTRDRHFRKLGDIAKSYRPEDIISRSKTF